MYYHIAAKFIHYPYNSLISNVFSLRNRKHAITQVWLLVLPGRLVDVAADDDDVFSEVAVSLRSMPVLRVNNAFKFLVSVLVFSSISCFLAPNPYKTTNLWLRSCWNCCVCGMGKWSTYTANLDNGFAWCTRRLDLAFSDDDWAVDLFMLS